MRYFYARVSSKEQNLARQLEAADKYEGGFDRIFVDKQSGKSFERPAWNELCSLLVEGDLLVVLDLDRIGRNYEETPVQWARITKEIGADIQVLNMPLLDTRRRGDDLTGKFIADLVFQVLNYVAEQERIKTKARREEGIAAMPVVDGKKISSKTGQGFGRPKKNVHPEFKKFLEMKKLGTITIAEACRRMNVSTAHWYRWEKQNETLK